MAHLLDQINSPKDLKHLNSLQVKQLAKEIRDTLIQSVSKTGGHMGPNLGVVELTIALHRVFNSPDDTIIFDTGHQAYVHKLLTGRKDFSTLRQPGGLSGYPSRNESLHDVVENSHASTALSWAFGVALGKKQRGDESWTVAVIGDGALTGGMAWEALNNIADHPELKIIIVVNDNGRSYARTIGGLSHHLDALRTNPRYKKTLSWGKRHLQSKGRLGQITYDALHSIKEGAKDFFVPQAMFSDLHIKYTGPVNGHDETATEFALVRAKEYESPLIIHVITQKGRGYIPAEEHKGDHFHAIGPIHPETGLPIEPSRFGWTKVFADEIVKLADKDPRIVGVTAAMLEPVGLKPFAEKYPDRVFDVGIAEQHAVTMCAGLSYAGFHPVFAVYATFLNRAFDQVLMDAGLHHEAVTIVLDRAGITGADGASHNGMWDIAMLSIVPGLRLAAPRDEHTLRQLLDKCMQINDGPSVIRYPKGSIADPLPAIDTRGDIDIIYTSAASGKKVLFIPTGPFVQRFTNVAKRLSDHNITVIDPKWLLPISEDLVRICNDADVIITAEDGILPGGFGSHLRDALPPTKEVHRYGISHEYIATNTRDNILEYNGLDEEHLYRSISELLQ